MMNQQMLPMPAELAPRIASRTTLVVVPVSLVGQWIQEAKRHITGATKLYAYHGGSRKRDPAFLSSQDIVVTTYEILGSDRGFHANRAKLKGNTECQDLDACPGRSNPPSLKPYSTA